MNKTVCTLVLLYLTNIGFAQNPVSYPKDTAISKPELNFEVLWHTFEDNYAFFKLRNVDWHKTYKTYRPLVSPATGDDSLFALFSKMLAPFQDNHINVIVPGVRQFKSTKSSQFAQEFPSDSLRKKFWQMVNHSLHQKQFAAVQFAGPQFKGNPLFTYTISGSIGYLRFNRCFVDADAESEPDTKVAAKILDTVFANFKQVKALVVDVRDNIGGNDEFPFEVAGRFTNRKVKGMYKQTRTSGAGYEDFGKLERWYINPTGKSAFTKPVVVLSNDKTVSASDVFAMIMSELPNVKNIGSNTRGIYSDMYGFTLPNGWLISLSNQRYYNTKMVCYEGTGTPVDIRVLNTRNDLDQMSDPVLKAALKELSQIR